MAETEKDLVVRISKKVKQEAEIIWLHLTQILETGYNSHLPRDEVSKTIYTNL